MKAVDMGKDTDGIRSQTSLGSWAEFDMKFNEDAIYCSGISHEPDSTRTFIDALRKQKPIEGFSGERLPASTFFYDQWAMSDMESVFGFTSRQEYAKATYSDYIKKWDEEWITFLKDHAGENIMSCLFLPKDTADRHPCAVMSIPVKDEGLAERRLQSLLHATPKEESVQVEPRVDPNYREYPRARRFRQYMLPRNTVLTQLTGITESALHTLACFYRGNLLLAPDAQSLSAYVDALENSEILDDTSVYEEGIGVLSPLYNFAMMVDMEEMMKQPETYVRLVPNFFFRQAKFFRHFVIAIQFTCTEGVIYPNLVLLYKGKVES